MEHVYHSSRTQGLKKIEPRHSTHQIAWVYAMESPVLCAMFLGNHSDLILQTSVSDGHPIIVERFAGALDTGYKSQSGSIYTLDGAGFMRGRTTFEPELVSEHACDVLAEERIEDVLPHILGLEAQGKVTIYRYPDLPSWMPADKGDLIEKVVIWARQPGSTILEAIEELHPDILDEVCRRLDAEPDVSSH